MLETINGNKTLMVLEKALDASSLRHSVIANNLTNVDTPGFKASRVLFEEELKKALDRETVPLDLRTTHSRHITLGVQNLDQVKARVSEDQTTVQRNDGNNVDIDAEMALLAKNTLYYNTLAQQTAGWFASLKFVINEGRR